MKFTTTIHQEPGKNHAGIPVPPEVIEELGAGKRPAVVVTIGGHTYRNSIGSMGGHSVISLSAANREAAGVVGGDKVEVTIELDTAPREVDVPEDLAAALKQDAAAAAAFEPLSYSRKSRIVLSVEGAKTEETRQRRIAKAVEDLKAGKA
ncbi:MAG: YdeI/OmpD-associated family protein [Dehalococcoidia bacterium]|nr:YdeI/OmpD-associated family protein [Dehalococcoidia bacterium]